MKLHFNIRNFFLSVAIVFLFASCEQNYFPKPQGYPRLDLPEHTYQTYNTDCPFDFKFSKAARIVVDSMENAEKCWININYPSLNANIHISYKPVSSFRNLYEMTEDAHTFAYKHAVKAEDIYDSVYRQPAHNVSGVVYEITGNTASSIQFFASDSVNHYLRGALYINSHPNKDSLAPVINFIKADIDTLLRSLRWK